ncbi:MAG: cytochrome c oxidase subunit I, partial [Gammaproteobacteria bacterium]|nr:cytochrome c oxidase subunit I [Gammaproteobacteria bacterium]
PLQPINQFITVCVFALVAVQAIYALNFIISIWKGKKAGNNPWHANSLEWTVPSPPPHGNFELVPIVYRGPYEYSAPDVEEDYWLQDTPPPSETAAPALEPQPVAD